MKFGQLNLGRCREEDGRKGNRVLGEQTHILPGLTLHCASGSQVVKDQEEEQQRDGQTVLKTLKEPWCVSKFLNRLNTQTKNDAE